MNEQSVEVQLFISRLIPDRNLQALNCKMISMKNSILFLLLITFKFSFSASVDTITVHSKSLMQDSKAVVVLPYSYSKNTANRYPVVYLLHGYTGDYTNWITRVPQIKQYADQFQLILVCPDGKNSWYIDSRSTSGSNYESYITKDIIPFVDSAYRTNSNRMQRAICGLSMGGHGALYLAMKHQDIFSAAGSMSGVLDLLPWKSKYGIEDIVGDTSSAVISRYSDLYIVDKSDTTLALTIECGISDPFIDANRRMHERLMELKIDHDYTERDGGHNWPYWRNAIAYQLLFFHKKFYGN